MASMPPSSTQSGRSVRSEVLDAVYGYTSAHHVEPLRARGVDEDQRVLDPSPVGASRRLDVAHLHRQATRAPDLDGLADGLQQRRALAADMARVDPAPGRAARFAIPTISSVAA